MKIIIIGGVAAGPKTAAVLARRTNGADITIFQKESQVSYASCGLPYFASGDINQFEALIQTSYGISRDADFFARTKGVKVVTETEIISIDRKNKCVTARNLKNGEESRQTYDRLALATGANPIRPPFPVPGADNIRSFTRPDDFRHFRRTAEQGKIGRAAIIGGGFIGCEMAEAVAGLWGIETILIEKENQLLPYILDKEMSSIAEREMTRQGITLHLGNSVKNIEICPDGSVKIDFGGTSATADYVLLCLGVRPEVRLAREAGLEIGETGAIKVNSYLQTSDPDIYAGGDCVESYNMVSGRQFYIPMGSLANRHGRVIAENIAGHRTEFKGAVGAFLVKIFDINVGAAGLSEQAAQKAGLHPLSVWGSFVDKPDYYPESKSFSLKMIYEDGSGRLLGLQAAGQGDICRRIDVYSAHLSGGKNLSDLLNFEHGYAPPYAEALDPLHQLSGLALAQERGLEIIPPRNETTAFWLDVREKEEIASTPLPFADSSIISIPLNDLRFRLEEIPRGKRINIICRRGPRAYQAAMILKQAGFSDVAILGGGIQALRD